uniref:bolA-like protein 1 n=1 Tax=Ciona intestinalis TaxID=7719 RepID=UPI0002B8D2EE|nr:bolA-like protein 1 [Ciona intestinalis]|eukprot:XP_004225911.1 bolA-like protein 1 [Ciona intestinalis]
MDSNNLGPVQQTIQEKLKSFYKPTYLEVVNESYKHSVPKGSESHFKVVVVSDIFDGQSHIQRHRGVNNLLKEELSGKIHALSIQAKTPSQWKASDQFVDSTPPCLGGSKADRK